VEKDFGEEMTTAGGQPCTTDSAARSERGIVCVEVVDDSVVQFLREGCDARSWVGMGWTSVSARGGKNRN
jgi:hypothetical protein